MTKYSLNFCFARVKKFCPKKNGCMVNNIYETFFLDLILTLLDRYVSFFLGEWPPLCIPCRFEMPFILIVFGLNNLGSLLKYVKNAHTLTSLVSPTSQVVLFF